MDGGPPLSTLVNDLLAYTRARMEEFGPLPVALDPRSSRQVVVNQWVVPKRQAESRSRPTPLFCPWRGSAAVGAGSAGGKKPVLWAFFAALRGCVNRLTAFRSEYLGPQVCACASPIG